MAVKASTVGIDAYSTRLATTNCGQNNHSWQPVDHSATHSASYPLAHSFGQPGIHSPIHSVTLNSHLFTQPHNQCNIRATIIQQHRQNTRDSEVSRDIPPMRSPAPTLSVLSPLTRILSPVTPPHPPHPHPHPRHSLYSLVGVCTRCAHQQNCIWSLGFYHSINLCCSG